MKRCRYFTGFFESMPTLIHKWFFLGCLLMMLSACNNSKKDDSASFAYGINQIEDRLLHVPLLALTDQWVCVIDKDSIIIMRSQTSEANTSLLRLEYISDSLSTVQTLDLNIQKPQLHQLNPQINFEVYKLPRKLKTFKNLIIIGLKGSSTLDRREVWKKTISADRIDKTGLIKCLDPEASFRIQLDNWVLTEHLKRGIFLSAQHGYHLLLFNRVAWVINKGSEKNEISQMLHFIEQDQPFDNYSFRTSSVPYENCVRGLLNDTLQITRIQLKKSFSEYDRIRIGQFTSEGNLWAQPLIVSRILDNELLRYERELQ